MADMLATAGWSPVAQLRELLAYPFMVNALEAGTIVAVTVAVVGWFVVLRGQTFVAHAMSVVAFPGAAAALLVGVPVLFGYLTSCTIGAACLSATSESGSRRYRDETAAVGVVQALALGAGFVFVSLAKAVLTSIDSLLFGSLVGVTTGEVLVLLAVCAAVLLASGVAGRALAFASLDPDVARARGVPVRALSVCFLLVLGLAVAVTSQITGTLLVFALLVTPAATAHELTNRPALSLALAVCGAVVVTWTGLCASYFSGVPVGFYVTTFAFGLYLLARVPRYWAMRRFSLRSSRGEVEAV